MKEKFKLLVLIICSLILLPKNVLAEVVNVCPNYNSTGDRITRFYVSYNGSVYGNGWSYTSIRVGGTQGDDCKTGKRGYCVDFYDGYPADPSYSSITFNRTQTKKLSVWLDENDGGRLTTAQANEAAEKINQYLYFGVGYKNQTDAKYELATQALIWELLFQNGYNYKYEATQGIGTVSFGLADKNNSVVGIDVTAEKNQILNNIETWNIKPSQCTNPKTSIQLKVGESKTITDTNSVLSDYKVTCSQGLTCTQSGNNLVITATEVKNSYTITFTKAATGSEAIVYVGTGSDEQGIVTDGTVPSVSCQITNIVVTENPKCTDTTRNTPEACKQKANDECGASGYTGCDTQGTDLCYSYVCKDAPTCTDNTRNTPEACKQKANDECGKAGYTGCTTQGTDLCYSYVCKDAPTCTDTTRNTPEACKQKANSECGSVGYKGCDTQGTDLCYSYVCNEIEHNPQTGTIAIIFTWVIGFLAISYVVWYYNQIKSYNNVQ